VSLESLSNADGRCVVIACRVMQPELEQARQGNNHLEVRYLDQGLHRTPQKMADLIQEEMERVDGDVGRIVLAYGLCSNGIVGIRAGRKGLIIPRCHDCIAFFLGSPAGYKEAFAARPGTYYLTPGWVAEKKDPLGIIEEEYVPRYGRETAQWAMEEELKHYTHISLINNGVGDIAALRARAMKNAEVLNKTYEEIEGTLDFFHRILKGPYTQEDFISLKPGEEITQEMFLN